MKPLKLVVYLIVFAALFLAGRAALRELRTMTRDAVHDVRGGKTHLLKEQESIGDE